MSDTGYSIVTRFEYVDRSVRRVVKKGLSEASATRKVKKMQSRAASNQTFFILPDQLAGKSYTKHYA